MSFGAFGGRLDIMGMFDPRSGSLTHAGTFNNNILSMAAGCAGCKILDGETTDRLNDLGRRMRELVQEVIQKELDSEGPHMNGIIGKTPQGNAILPRFLELIASGIIQEVR